MIPLYEPMIGKKESEYLNRAFKSGWISSKGDFIDKFEKQFAKYIGTKYALTTTSGTTALHLSLASLGIHPGDEVIIPAFTMAATAFAVVYLGAKPVLVDSEPETYNIDFSKIEEKITKKTKAIVVVHIYGHPCDMDPILKIAKKYHLHLIEDAAEACGAEYRGRKVGGIGEIGCFSFYANKTITTGEGGMLVTNSKKIFEKAQSLKNMAFGLGVNRFKHLDIGYNFRMTNLQAAIGLSQLENIEKIIKKKRELAQKYMNKLSRVPNINFPIEKEWARSIYWMFAITLKNKNNDYLIKILDKAGIESRSFFTPIHKQPVFIKKKNFSNESYPISEEISKRGLYLPSSPKLNDSQVNKICNVIKKNMI